MTNLPEHLKVMIESYEHSECRHERQLFRVYARALEGKVTATDVLSLMTSMAELDLQARKERLMLMAARRGGES